MLPAPASTLWDSVSARPPPRSVPAVTGKASRGFTGLYRFVIVMLGIIFCQRTLGLLPVLENAKQHSLSLFTLVFPGVLEQRNFLLPTEVVFTKQRYSGVFNS